MNHLANDDKADDFLNAGDTENYHADLILKQFVEVVRVDENQHACDKSKRRLCLEW